MDLNRTGIPIVFRTLALALVLLLSNGQPSFSQTESWDTTASHLGDRVFSPSTALSPPSGSSSLSLRPLKTPLSRGAFATDAERVGAAVKAAVNAMAAGKGDKRADPGITPEQSSQAQALAGSNTDGRMVRIQFNADDHTVDTIKMGVAKIGTPRARFDLEAAQLAAGNFLSAQRDLITISDPARDLQLKEGWMDELGVKHFRYQQMVAGIPVWGREAAVHLDAEDQVYFFNGRYARPPEALPVTEAEIPVDTAVDLALQHFGVPLAAERVTRNGLVWIPGNTKQLHLCHHLTVTAAADNCWDYFVDARSGEVVKRVSRVMAATITASGVDLNGAQQQFTAWEEPGRGYYLIDPTAPLDDPPHSPLPDIRHTGNIYVLDAMNTQDRFDFSAGASPSSGWDPAGVSLMQSIHTVLDYYERTFNRNSLDDQNVSVLGIIHFGQNFSNAFWGGGLIGFGDGDGTTFSNWAGSLDFVAHEMQHGVTEHCGGLVYENQSGALNEAYSDIFGCMVDRDDWTMGEDIYLPAPGYARNLANPALGHEPLPSKMSEYRNLPVDYDHGGVHVNCLIPGRAAYLIAEGLSVEGQGTSIGRDKTEQIFYRALTAGYLLPNAEFLDAREATLQAAEDLYGAGSMEVAAVQAGWDVVEVVPGGIGTPNDRTPSPTDPASGADLVVYLYPSDGSHDRPFHRDELYDLYVQTLPSPFSGYDQNQDLKVADSLPNYTRPAVITTSEGTLVLFAGRDYNLYLVPADGSMPPQQLTQEGNVYSVAASPDGRHLAFTSPDEADDRIYLYNLTDQTSTEIALQSPSTEYPTPNESDSHNTILYADALAFDYSSNLLVFDTLNCLSTPESDCQSGEGFRYWSIGLLDLATGELAYPFKGQNPMISFGYPSFAANNNFVVALDAIDESNYSTAGEILSQVITVDFRERSIQSVFNPNLGTPDRPVWGAPSFWGDDRYITVQVLNDTSGSVTRIPVNSDWSGTPSGAESLNDYDAAMPIMHRAGVRSLSGSVQLSSTALNFGAMASGESSSDEITLRNTGNRDIKIRNIATASGTRTFAHNGTNGLLPRGQQMTITVTYTAGPTAGSESDTLAITSDADTPTLSISLVGQSTGTGDGTPDDGDDGSDDGGGGGEERGSGGSSSGGGGGCLITTLRASSEALD